MNQKLTPVTKNALVARQEAIKKAFDRKQEEMLALFQQDQSKVNRFISQILRLSVDRKLANCDQQSFFDCAVDCAEIGLMPQKQLGLIYFVPYKGQAQLMIGYKGWQALLQRSGQAIKANPVFECDAFSYEVDDFDEKVSLIPDFDLHNDTDPKWVNENIKGVLVRIKDINTSVVTQTYVSVSKLKQLRGFSPSIKNKRSSPWDEHPKEMFMAKAIKYVISKTPMASQIGKAVEIEDSFEVKLQKDAAKPVSYVAQDIKQTQEKTQDDTDIEQPEAPENYNQDNEQPPPF